MNKLGKEAKVLLYGITITCVISFILAFGISSLMANDFITVWDRIYFISLRKYKKGIFDLDLYESSAI